LTTTTAAEFDVLLAEDAAAEAAVAEADGDPDAYAMASERYREAYLAVVNARPTDPNWAMGDTRQEHRMLRHIADQLERLASAVILPAAAVSHIELVLEHALALKQVAGEPPARN
jgi:hypothetical protein